MDNLVDIIKLYSYAIHVLFSLVCRSKLYTEIFKCILAVIYGKKLIILFEDFLD